MEGRGCRKWKPLAGNMAGTQEPDDVSTKTQRIAAQARTHPDRAFVSLAHHIDLDWLHTAYRREIWVRKFGSDCNGTYLSQNPLNSSFPRMQESSDFGKLGTSERSWMPAFAGMTTLK